MALNISPILPAFSYFSLNIFKKGGKSEANYQLYIIYVYYMFYLFDVLVTFPGGTGGTAIY